MTLKIGKPWAKFVVPSSGSTYQQYSLVFSLQPAFFADDAVGGEVGLQALDDQFFAGAVGLGDEVELAFEFVADAAFEIVSQQRAGFAGDVDCGFQYLSHVVSLP